MPERNAPPIEREPSAQEAFQVICTIYQFHRICGDALCRRARECRGDSEACFYKWWEHFPEQEKIRFRVVILEREKGASPADAVARAEAAAAQYLEQQRAQAEAEHRPVTIEQVPREAPQPRVRIG